MSRYSLVTIAVALFSAWVPSTLAADTVFTRATVLESAVGDVQFTRAYTVPLTLPSSDCPDGRFSCTSSEVYGQVYGMRFSRRIEIVRESEGMTSVDVEPKGGLYLALELDTEKEQALEDDLRERFTTRGAESFVRSWAGFRSGSFQRPMIDSMRTGRTGWVCVHDGDSWKADIYFRRDESWTVSSKADETAEACRELERAVAATDAETIRTRIETRVQRRQAVRLTTASTTDRLVWADRLVTLPESVEFEKRPTGDEKSGGSRDRRRGVFNGKEGRFHRIERKVSIPHASLQLVGMPMWVLRFEFESIRETFGVDPRTVADPTQTLDVAVIPIVDPLMSELDRTQRALEYPAQQLVEEVRSRLARSRELEPEQVDRALADPELWPAAGDWLIVSCYDDGTARFGIAPFTAAAKVTNARDACAAIRIELDD